MSAEVNALVPFLNYICTNGLTQSKTESCDQERRNSQPQSQHPEYWMMGLATPAPNMWESSVEEMMEATGDTLLENLHQRDLPVSQRRRQPTPTKNTVAHVTGEALSRTQPMKVHSVSWPRPKHREVQMIPLPTLVGAEEAERGSSELVPAAAGSVSWGAAAAQTRCGSSCRRC